LLVRAPGAWTRGEKPDETAPGSLNRGLLHGRISYDAPDDGVAAARDGRRAKSCTLGGRLRRIGIFNVDKDALNRWIACSSVTVPLDQQAEGVFGTG
ncbi:MAG: hypothetical protein AB7G35_08615, partial [Hyphomicrobiaceae bacterium]